MTWQGIQGHDDVVAQFRAMLARGRLASTFLFVGPAGVGKRMFARRLAQALLCSERPAEALDPCGVCPACLQVLAGTHPDLLWIEKPADKSFLPVELFIGTKQRRMQEGLCHDISLKPFMGGRRVGVINDADYLNEEGANSLLKTLEEPPPRSVLILIGTSPGRQLPTIRSRAQVIRFRPLPAEVISELLMSQGVTTDQLTAERLAARSGGSLELATEMAAPELSRFRDVLLAQLREGDFDNVAFAKTLIAFVDEAGKDASVRRARLRLVIGMAVDFYRELLRATSGGPSSLDAFVPEVIRANQSGRFNQADIAGQVDRCLEALQQVERNANQGATVECWLDDLTQLACGGTIARSS